MNENNNTADKPNADAATLTIVATRIPKALWREGRSVTDCLVLQRARPVCAYHARSSPSQPAVCRHRSYLILSLLTESQFPEKTAPRTEKRKWHQDSSPYLAALEVSLMRSEIWNSVTHAASYSVPKNSTLLASRNGFTPNSHPASLSVPESQT